MKKPKIIVVDDMLTVRLFLCFALGGKYEIVEASNGFEGLEAFQKNPDSALMISDTQMPVMSGPELIEKIKSKRPDFPIILMSAAKEHIGHKADMFLSKLADTELLQKSIETLLLKNFTPAPQ